MAIPTLENGSRIIDAEFLASKTPPAPPNAKVLNPEAMAKSIDLVAAELNKLVSKTDSDRFTTDGRMAAFLHRELKLTLYEASQDEFWHFVAVLKCPNYVAWRWFSPKLNAVPKNRFLGAWYKNALGRLWWWAEYTHNPILEKEGYSRTIKAAESQEFMRDTIENSLCGNRDLVNSLCDAAFPASGPRLIGDEIREMVKRINAMLVTTALDALEAAEVNEVVKSVVKEMKAPERKADAKPKKQGLLARLTGR